MASDVLEMPSDRDLNNANKFLKPSPRFPCPPVCTDAAACGERIPNGKQDEGEGDEGEAGQGVGGQAGDEEGHRDG